MPFDFKRWYEEEGEELNKRRRGRYQKDPDYRKKVLAQNKVSREKRQKVAATERQQQQKAIRIPARATPWKTQDGVVPTKDGDVQATMFTIGAMARALGVSVQVIRIWERKGELPETPFRNDKGDRLYTTEQVELAHELMLQQGKVLPEQVRKSDPRSDKGYVWEVELAAGGGVVEKKMFRIGALARSIGRKVITVEQMEHRGVLPPTPFRATKIRYRLYTPGMIESVRVAMSSRGGRIRGVEDWESFRSEVYTAWKAQGVIGAKLRDRK